MNKMQKKGRYQGTNVTKLRSAVIPSQASDWRGNPFSNAVKIRIATPVCALVRNDTLT